MRQNPECHRSDCLMNDLHGMCRGLSEANFGSGCHFYKARNAISKHDLAEYETGLVAGFDRPKEKLSFAKVGERVYSDDRGR